MGYESRWPLRRKGPRTGAGQGGLHYDPRFVRERTARRSSRGSRPSTPSGRSATPSAGRRPRASRSGSCCAPSTGSATGSSPASTTTGRRTASLDRCVTAEPFPPVLAKLVERHRGDRPPACSRPDMPAGWHAQHLPGELLRRALEGERWVDTARVGEHQDFEPGPRRLALARGARALPVRRQSPAAASATAWSRSSGSMTARCRSLAEISGSASTFHRVQRVDHRAGFALRACRSGLRDAAGELHVPRSSRDGTSSRSRSSPSRRARDVEGYSPRWRTPPRSSRASWRARGGYDGFGLATMSVR